MVGLDERKDIRLQHDEKAGIQQQPIYADQAAISPLIHRSYYYHNTSSIHCKHPIGQNRQKRIPYIPKRIPTKGYQNGHRQNDFCGDKKDLSRYPVRHGIFRHFHDYSFRVLVDDIGYISPLFLMMWMDYLLCIGGARHINNSSSGKSERHRRRR